jgi:hypothetical protein
MEALGVRRRWLSALSCLALLSAQRAASAQSSPNSASPHATAPVSSSQTATSTSAPAPAAAPALPEPSSAHGSRLPAFIALGLGGLAAGGALFTGMLANSDYNDAQGSCSPACSDRELAPGRTLALTSTILTGVAVLGVGVGVTLLFTSGPDPAQLGLAPRLRLATAPGAARAEASWSF